VTPVRPSLFPAAPAVQPQADAARVAAQKAFFEMAMGRTPAPAAARAAPDAAAPARIHRIPDPAAPAPQKLLRPGSLLDIKV